LVLAHQYHTRSDDNAGIFLGASAPVSRAWWTIRSGVFVPVIVEVVWAAVNSILVLPAMERVLRGKDYSIDELEEKKDFEARRRDVWEVEVRQPNGLSPGLVEFRLRSPGVVKVRMLWTRGRAERFAEVFRLVETFTARQPFYNYKGWAIWRLD